MTPLAIIISGAAAMLAVQRWPAWNDIGALITEALVEQRQHDPLFSAWIIRVGGHITPEQAAKIKRGWLSVMGGRCVVLGPAVSVERVEP